ncbi:hypothetical protein D3C87_1687100 [compost metagenome]
MRQFLRDRNTLTLGPFWYGAILVWGIVPNDVNDTFIRVPRLDLGEKLNGANPIDGGWLNKGRVEGFQVQSAVNVHAAAARCRLSSWI